VGYHSIQHGLARLACVAALFAVPPRAARAGGPDESLRRELLERMKEDQDLRREAIRITRERDTGDPDVLKRLLNDPVLKRGAEIDQRNTARMKEIVDRYGWPGYALVGKDGAAAAWLLVQHADRDPAFQKRCLPLLIDAVKKGDASAQNMAYLTDRVRIADKQKQVYGTQFIVVRGKLRPQPIEDEDHVDARREEVGLQTMAEYQKLAETVYNAKPATEPPRASDSLPTAAPKSPPPACAERQCPARAPRPCCGRRRARRNPVWRPRTCRCARRGSC